MDKLVTFLLGLEGPVPYLIVFAILLACGLGLPIPEDVTLFAAGLSAYYGKANHHLMVLVSLFGVLIGDSFVFWLGAAYGKKVLKRWPFKNLLTPSRERVIKERIRTHGNKFIFTARFMPGLRAPIYFTSGLMHMRFRVFIFYDGIAALISVPLIVYALYYFGEHVDKVIRIIRKAQYGIWITILLVGVFFVSKWLANRRNIVK